MGRPMPKVAFAASAALFFALIAFVGCGKDPRGGASRQKLLDPGALAPGASLILELQDQEAALKDGVGGFLSPIASDASALSPAKRKKPWTRAVAPAGIVRSGDTLAVAVNGRGLAFFDAGSAKPSFSIVSDPSLFEGRAVTAVYAAAGRVYVFLSANDTFGGAAPASALASIAPGETVFRVEEYPFASRYPAPWDAVSWGLGQDGLIRVQLRRPIKGIEEKEDAGEDAYLEIGPGGSWKPVGQGEFLLGWEPSAGSRLPPALAGLYDPALAAARYGSAFAASSPNVIMDLREAPGFAGRAYVLSGERDSFLSARVSGWSDGSVSAAIHPDGSLRLREGQSGPVISAAFPALPPTFDYGDVAAAGDWVLASWAETVFPEIGRSGLALYRRK